MSYTKTTFRVSLQLLVIVLSVISSAGQSDDAALVEQFFPGNLVTEAEVDFADGGPTPSRNSHFVPADLDGTGNPDYLVAAYTNGFSGIVRVLKKQNNSATVVAEPSLPLMGGIVPRVSLINLDADQRPEVVVNFSSATGGSADWIFKWGSGALSLFGPFIIDEDGDLATVLHEAGFVDLTGDGIPEIVNPPERTFTDNPTTVYELAGGTYSLTTMQLYHMQVFVRRTGTPVTETETFSVPDPSTPHVMIISNGNSTGGNRASSVDITLNGVPVAGANQFNQQVRTLRIPITVSSSNTLDVRFAASPESEITILIGTE